MIWYEFWDGHFFILSLLGAKVSPAISKRTLTLIWQHHYQWATASGRLCLIIQKTCIPLIYQFVMGNAPVMWRNTMSDIWRLIPEYLEALLLSGTLLSGYIRDTRQCKRSDWPNLTLSCWRKLGAILVCLSAFRFLLWRKFLSWWQFYLSSVVSKCDFNGNGGISMIRP